MKINYQKQIDKFIPNKDRINIIKTLYLLDKTRQEMRRQNDLINKLLNKENKKNKNEESSLTDFQDALTYMDQNNAKFIKEYVIMNKKSDDTFLSKSSFYRQRKMAIEEFFYYFLTR
ncbi:hypothetical protein [Mycoplasma tauri]|nr:hypothetical protein [Mycoplasma tauri]MBZ4203515.1 hypothetical protein [Mycoplasma tauri]MBZ4203971.1 hypothetical protein [Mycoplasma tauri]MBZ4212813.1 hypothetical protein [Mycoplasma tauri]MBZ4218464.1 hypothetical protein [Mycoplasma tauri]QSB07552.1 hypothetical protein JS510_00240 [Mycoplasma tauri]